MHSPARYLLQMIDLHFSRDGRDRVLSYDGVELNNRWVWMSNGTFNHPSGVNRIFRYDDEGFCYSVTGTDKVHYSELELREAHGQFLQVRIRDLSSSAGGQVVAVVDGLRLVHHSPELITLEGMAGGRIAELRDRDRWYVAGQEIEIGFDIGSRGYFDDLPDVAPLGARSRPSPLAARLSA
jgi:hypothetical protein